MKRLIPILAAAALATACSGSSSSTSGSTGGSTTATTGTGSTTTTTTAASSSTGSHGTTSGGTTGQTTGQTTATSSGSTGTTATTSSGSTGTTSTTSTTATTATNTSGSGSTGTTSTTSTTTSGTTTSGCSVVISTTGTPPANDNCGAPEAISALDTDVPGDTTNAQNDFAYATSADSCTGFRNSGPDVVYSWTSPGAGDFDVTVTPTVYSDGGSWDPAIYVLDSCPATCADTQACLAGADNTFTGEAETFRISASAANTPYFIVVDRYSGTSTTSNLGGPFTIRVSQHVTPLGDACSNPDTTSLVLTQSGSTWTGSVNFDTTNYGDDSKSGTSTNGAATCSHNGAGPDIVYAFTVPSGVTSLTASVTSSTGSGLDPIVYVRTSPCSDVGFNDGGAGAEILCDAPGNGPGTATDTATGITAGTYYVWVDSYGGAAGPGTLTITAQ